MLSSGMTADDRESHLSVPTSQAARGEWVEMATITYLTKADR